ncbi:hypothetical protein OAF67_05835, partial [Akkermansiaceae bacterium]|nr:hypothetical protein [Akkermansiaceae bacterium]
MKFLFLFLLPLSLFADEDRLILVGASYGKNVLAICEADGSVLWQHKTEGPQSGHTGHHDVQLLADGNILFHDSWSVTSEITPKKEIVWKHDSKGANVHAFQRLENGHTMIAESGLGRIVHLDKKG